MSEQAVKICYLVNYYPKISHTFIRREILALERLGAEVIRVSVRQSPEALTDQIDAEEQVITQYVLNQPKSTLIKNTFNVAVSQPWDFFRGIKKTASLALSSGEYLKSLFYLIEACTILKICVDNHVQHLHAHFGTNPTALASIIRALGGPEYSFTIHGPDEFDAPKVIDLHQKIADAKFVSAITHFCKSQLFRWAKYSDWKKIKVVHCAIDGNMISAPTSQISTHKKLLNIGRLSEQKGQMLLLEAIKMVKERGATDIKLDIVGDGELRGEMEHYIEKHQLDENIQILGWKSGDEILKLLDQSTAMILPSFAEGLPVVIMEAFGRARPVITTYIAGIPELVDEQCGFVVTPGDVDDLVVNIERFIATGLDVLNDMGSEGRARVLKEHNADTEAEKLLSHITAETVD